MNVEHRRHRHINIAVTDALFIGQHTQGRGFRQTVQDQLAVAKKHAFWIACCT